MHSDTLIYRPIVYRQRARAPPYPFSLFARLLRLFIRPIATHNYQMKNNLIRCNRIIFCLSTKTASEILRCCSAVDLRLPLFVNVWLTLSTCNPIELMSIATSYHFIAFHFYFCCYCYCCSCCSESIWVVRGKKGNKSQLLFLFATIDRVFWFSINVKCIYTFTAPLIMLLNMIRFDNSIIKFFFITMLPPPSPPPLLLLSLIVLCLLWRAMNCVIFIG